MAVRPVIKGFEFFLERLLKGFRSVKNREPDNLEMILIKQEAAQKARDANKVIDVDFDKGRWKDTKGITSLMESGDVKIGTAPKTPPYQKSQADIDFEIMERIKADNKKAVEAFEKRNPRKPEKFFYGGFVEQPELGPTAHGSEALASRTRLAAPGSTSTTSTGLNYLLAEDNDNQRVPFDEGGSISDVLPPNFDELDHDELMYIIKLLQAGEIPQYADGGRIGFKLGGIDKGRRAFLKLMGGAAAGIGALKAGALKLLGKEGATVAKEVITTPNVVGKPAWFDPLVTRIINEGEDVTKQFAYKERMRVHTKPISETEEVTIYRDLDDGSVRVNYGQKLKIDDTKPYEKGNIGRASNDPDQIDLIVRQGEEVEPDLKTGKGGGKTKASFEASEAEPRAAGGPEDADIEFDGIREVDNVDDLMQDVSVLEEFATGKKLTGKKAAKAKKKREDYQRFTEDQVEQANYLEEKYGPAERYYDEDFASGGRAGYFLGGKVGAGILKLLKNKKKVKAAYDDIFPSGDYKYDAEMVAESLVENNPRVFGNRLYSDLTDAERFEVYGAALNEASTNFAKQLKLKRAMDKASKPTKTLEGIEKTGTIDISDDAIAEEFATFMKETDPVGHAKIQKVVDDANQKIELKRFKTKGRKPNALGGLANMLGE